MTFDVGVIIPTFNRPEETLRALESVIKQTVKPSEIIIIDDGSDRASLERLKNYTVDFDVIIIESKPNRHPGKARNIGLKHLNSKWVAFLDSDDYWLPDKIEKQIETLQRHKVKALCSNAYISSNGKNEKYLAEKKSFKIKTSRLLRSNLIINSSVMVEREVLKNVDNIADSYSVRGAEDYATWLRVSCLTDWYFDCRPLLVYSDNSRDSMRKDDEFQNNFAYILGILNFQNWLSNRSKTRKFLLKMYLKALGPIINVSKKRFH